MYLSHWRLAAKPFEPRPASDAFYFPCESHEGALSKLRYAVEAGRGAAALAGPSGVGKTLLVRRLAATLGPSIAPVVEVVCPAMSGRDLLAYLVERLGAPAPERPTGAVEESVRRLEALAEKLVEQGQRPLVVIDEAQLLEDSGALETLRLLTNFFSGERPALTLLLVGQMGLLSAIARHPTLDERLAVKTLVRGFTALETEAYVAHRLAAAGAERPLFTPDAVERLHTLTGGIARQIDRLADLALVVGYAARGTEVGADEVRAVHQELVAIGGD